MKLLQYSSSLPLHKSKSRHRLQQWFPKADHQYSYSIRVRMISIVGVMDLETVDPSTPDSDIFVLAITGTKNKKGEYKHLPRALQNRLWAIGNEEGYYNVDVDDVPDPGIEDFKIVHLPNRKKLVAHHREAFIKALKHLVT